MHQLLVSDNTKTKKMFQPQDPTGGYWDVAEKGVKLEVKPSALLSQGKGLQGLAGPECCFCMPGARRGDLVFLNQHLQMPVK